MGTPRNFNYFAFDTLSPCKTLAKQCFIDKVTIVQKRPSCLETYFPNLVATILYFLR